MRLRLLVGIAGAEFAHAPGEIIERPDKEAHRMIAADIAEAVDPEAATSERRETATRRKPRRR